MKKILVTGTSGYVSKNLMTWLNSMPYDYCVECISLRDNAWRSMDFSMFDVVIHTAAIVHQRETVENASSYKRINTDLTSELASKVRLYGVKHFIFISSMAVYGIEGELGKSMVISLNTPCNPTTLYGKSKLAAEVSLKDIQDKNFIVTIVRPPMVYGPNCPGNYAHLRKLAMNWSLYPKICNQRSMIFIDNLCSYLEKIISKQKGGTFLPQNIEYVSTSELVKLIAKQHGRKVYFSKLLGVIIKVLPIGPIKKLYGNLIYEHSPNEQVSFEQFVGLEESVCICENRYKSTYL